MLISLLKGKPLSAVMVPRWVIQGQKNAVTLSQGNPICPDEHSTPCSNSSYKTTRPKPHCSDHLLSMTTLPPGVCTFPSLNYSLLETAQTAHEFLLDQSQEPSPGLRFQLECRETSPDLIFQQQDYIGPKEEHVWNV